MDKTVDMTTITPGNTSPSPSGYLRMIHRLNGKNSDVILDRGKRSLKTSILIFVSLAILFLGLNARQLFSNWAIRSETRRLERLAVYSRMNSKILRLSQIISKVSYPRIFGISSSSMAMERFQRKVIGMQLRLHSKTF